MPIPGSWGTAPAERRLEFPCDRHVVESAAAYYRGVDIEASSALVFRWLCQLRIAPYSYDWIDNFGRRSPQSLIDGLQDLAQGQTFMRIFELVDFAPDRHLTLRTKPERRATRIFGDVWVSYLILPLSATNSRLLVKLRVRYTRGVPGRLMRLVLPWGDWIMMRRQLLNFRRLAQRSQQAH